MTYLSFMEFSILAWCLHQGTCFSWKPPWVSYHTRLEAILTPHLMLGVAHPVNAGWYMAHLMFTLISASQNKAHYLLVLVVGAVLLPLPRVSTQQVPSSSWCWRHSIEKKVSMMMKVNTHYLLVLVIGGVSDLIPWIFVR